MPTQGLFAKVQGRMPAVTNTNNAGICCGVPASKHGISGNSYLNLETSREDFMEDAAFLRAPRSSKKRPLRNLLSSPQKRNRFAPQRRVNGRGPFVKGRDISVTLLAAKRLGFTRSGTADLDMETLK